MTPREELIEIITRPGVVHHFMAQADVERLADAILAAGYRKVEAGRDARETARKLLIEIGHCGIFEGHKGREFLVNDEHIAHIATAITATVEAQLERDAELARRCIAGDALEEKEGSFHPASKIGQVRELANKIAAAIREG